MNDSHNSTRPVLVDLFCCEGGGAAGYHRAGFDVIGIDIAPQPRYPYRFVQADVTELTAADLLGLGAAAVHASPPCQQHTSLRARTGRTYPDLIAPTRALLAATGLPTVMENVPGAPLRPDVVLCGSMFGLGAAGRVLRRHRWFETSTFVLTSPDQCAGRLIGGVYGTGGGGQMTRGYKFTPVEARGALQTPWMSRAGLAQCIPPAYTEFLGEALLKALTLSRAPLPSRRQAKPLRGFCGARNRPARPAADLARLAGPAGSVLPSGADVWAGERPPARAEDFRGAAAGGSTCTAGRVTA